METGYELLTVDRKILSAGYLCHEGRWDYASNADFIGIYEETTVITGLLLCLVVLFAQLGVLHYLDRRVAAMPRMSDIAPGQLDDLLIMATEPPEPGAMPGRVT
ncbi:hypothetical protein KG088_10805 [Halomonas sp. TRM85114]|uniref:hypothetical protein n=1 Tax=Halomonas jincaotanensis TaxID=2810616 RepID=UPI001BD65EB8|nr:hypothetical protein [Halomonas jincaotanensis]MBS9404120.1 hypothetical protein [Halomonas jincaotanensis]